jgi:hypothetical protein
MVRLANEERRSSLEQLRRNTITIAECEESMDRMRAVVSSEILRLPANLSGDLANREPQHIQQVLDAALISALARLSRLENYLYSIYDRPDSGAKFTCWNTHASKGTSGCFWVERYFFLGLDCLCF